MGGRLSNAERVAAAAVWDFLAQSGLDAAALQQDISDAPPPPPPAAAGPVMTAEMIAEEQAERARNVLDRLHPSESAAAGPSALDAGTTVTVKTIAQQSGLGAEAIAAMLKLDVAAVRAALES